MLYSIKIRVVELLTLGVICSGALAYMFVAQI